MGWKIIGDVLVLNKDVLDAQKLLEIPNVNTVVKLDRIEGHKRKPKVKVLIGDNTKTIHRENNCLFKLDVSKVMWSKGNTTERMRIANLVEEGEVVVDMFAGIGYFSIPMAVHSRPKKVYSIEINPVAYYYLGENIKLNRVQGIVEPMLGDCREVTPRGVADRVLMGYLGNTNEYLDLALNTLNGGGIIHYHEAVPERIRFERPIKRIREAANGRKVKILNKRVIKRYSPGVDHVVVDAMVF